MHRLCYILATVLMLVLLNVDDNIGIYEANYIAILESNDILTLVSISDDSISKHLTKLQELGIDSAILADMEIKIQPDLITYKDGDTQRNASGLCTLTTITVVEDADISVLYHEIGHAIHNKKMATNGYDWSSINDVGRQYIQLTGYNKALDYDTQVALLWEDRVAEWFAEDVAQFLESRMLGRCRIKNAGPDKTKEIDELLTQLIFTN